MTKGRIAPVLVTPTAGESILKLRFCCDVLPLQTSPQPSDAAGVCCLYSLMHFKGWGSRPSPNAVHNPNGISIGAAVLLRLTVVSNRQTDSSVYVIIIRQSARGRYPLYSDSAGNSAQHRCLALVVLPQHVAVAFASWPCL